MWTKVALAAGLLGACSSDEATGSVQPEASEAGVRSLSGLVLREGGEALVGVTVRESGGAATTTDASGHFLLVGLPSSVELVVDGTTASVPGQAFPSVLVTVELVAASNVLDRPVVLPDLQRAGVARASVFVDADSVASEAIQAVRASSDLALAGPAGTSVSGVPPSATFELSIVEVQAHELAAPVPADTFVVSAAFVAPVGARFDPPLSVRLPNPHALPPGTAAQLLTFDEASRLWVPAGEAGTAIVREGEGEVTRLESGRAVEAGGWYVAVLPTEEACLASIFGRVVDRRDDTPLGGVNVLLGTSGSTTTDGNGEFRFDGVPAFDMAELLASGECRSAPVTFRVTTPLELGGANVTGVLEQVELGGESPLFDGGVLRVEVTTTGSVAGLLDGPFDPARPVSILRIPGLQLAASALPSVSGSFSAHGLDPGAYRASYSFDGSEEASEVAFEIGPAFLTLVTLSSSADGAAVGGAPADLVYAVPSPTYVVGRAIAPNVPSVVGPVDSYTVAPPLPPGFTLEPVTGVLAGTPVETAAATTFVITAANGVGSVQTSIVVAVHPEAPSALSYGEPLGEYIVGVPIPDNSPTVTGEVDGFAVAPDLPAGLALDPATGVVSGTPLAVAPATEHTVTASNVTGSISTVLTIAVAPPAPPLALAYAENPATYRVGVPATNVPTVDGFVTSFSASPALPAGLSIDAITGVLSGTPAVAAAPQAYTVTAANSSGSVSTALTIAVVELHAPGRIVVNHDEHTFKDGALSPSPFDEEKQFASNVADWFTSGLPGSFLVYSEDPLSIQNEIEVFMEGLGHAWEVENALTLTFDLPTISQYDAVFLAFPDCPPAEVLVDYVESGGNVYVAGGTQASDLHCWNPFLEQFGLSMGGLNSLGSQSIRSSHPILHGVESLFADNGSQLFDDDPSDGANQIIAQSSAGVGLLAVYDGRFHETALRYETYATVPRPVQMSFDGEGVLYVGQDDPDTSPVPVHRVGAGGTPVEEYGEPMADPDAVLFDAEGLAGFGAGAVLVGNSTPDQCAQGHVLALDAVDQEPGVLVAGSSGTLGNPNDLVFTRGGGLLIADDTGCSQAGAVLISDPPGSTPVALVEDPLRFGQLALAPDEDAFFIADIEGGVRKFDLSGNASAFEPLPPALLQGDAHFSAVAAGPGQAPWGLDLVALSHGGLLRRAHSGGAGTFDVLGMDVRASTGAIRFGPDGALYASRTADDLILRITPVTPSRLVDFQLTATGEGSALGTFGILTVTGDAALAGGSPFGFQAAAGADLALAPPFSDPGNICLTSPGGLASADTTKTIVLDFASAVTQVSFVVADVDAEPGEATEQLTATALDAVGGVLHQVVRTALPDGASDGGVLLIDFGTVSGIRAVVLELTDVTTASAALGFAVDDVRFVPMAS